MDAPMAPIELDALPEGRGCRGCKAGHDLAVFRAGEAVYAIDDSCEFSAAMICNAHPRKTRQ